MPLLYILYNLRIHNEKLKPMMFKFIIMKEQEIYGAGPGQLLWHTEANCVLKQQKVRLYFSRLLTRNSFLKFHNVQCDQLKSRSKFFQFANINNTEK